ncbi:uncharacterized protein LOC130998257 [Salvia miltiorrhiza]|uniref:uncharacterized protein LOC130998257 n=1 Tax=Salvia miltiorrhiza TaxID=226208 RepID=UPI0025AC6508|nr:uncharacterized protein LOC130998257 [Salvia miltiorrhiza]
MKLVSPGSKKSRSDQRPLITVVSSGNTCDAAAEAEKLSSRRMLNKELGAPPHRRFSAPPALPVSAFSPRLPPAPLPLPPAPAPPSLSPPAGSSSSAARLPSISPSASVAQSAGVAPSARQMESHPAAALIPWVKNSGGVSRIKGMFVKRRRNDDEDGFGVKPNQMDLDRFCVFPIEERDLSEGSRSTKLWKWIFKHH